MCAAARDFIFGSSRTSNVERRASRNLGLSGESSNSTIYDADKKRSCGHLDRTTLTMRAWCSTGCTSTVYPLSMASGKQRGSPWSSKLHQVPHMHSDL